MMANVQRQRRRQQWQRGDEVDDDGDIAMDGDDNGEGDSALGDNDDDDDDVATGCNNEDNVK